MGAVGDRFKDISAMRADSYEMGMRAAMLLNEPRRPAQHFRVEAKWGAGRTIRKPP